MSKLKVFSICTGVGGLDNPFVNSKNFELVGYCEVDENCKKVLRYHYPNVKNYGDITKVKTDELPDFNILIGGTPCFVAGTFITTRRGNIPIEEVKVGDVVLTHKGNWKKVLRIGSKDNQETREIRGMGFLTTRTTDEHPYYCVRKRKVWDNPNRTYRREFTELDWEKAENLQRGLHYTSQVLPKEENIEGDYNFWWVVGRYIADGWLRNRCNRNNGKKADYVLICCGKHEKDELEANLKKSFKFTISEERTSYRFQIADTKFARFLEDFGRGAGNKEIPPKFYGLSIEQAKGFLDGYFSGDGWENAKYFGATTISPKLTIGLSILIQRVYGKVASTRLCKVPRTKVIEGRTVNQSNFYQVIYRKGDKGLHGHVRGTYGYKPIRYNEPTGKREVVYNLEVAEDNSYVANGCIVHNCQSFSFAGNSEGLQGKSGLFYQYIRILKDKKPDYCLWENVKGTLSCTQGWDFAYVQMELAEAGYSFRWEILNGGDYGVPQNRERVFIIGVLRGRGSRKLLCES